MNMDEFQTLLDSKFPGGVRLTYRDDEESENAPFGSVVSFLTPRIMVVSDKHAVLFSWQGQRDFFLEWSTVEEKTSEDGVPQVHLAKALHGADVVLEAANMPQLISDRNAYFGDDRLELLRGNK